MSMPLGCWEQKFPHCEPVAHRLRTAFSERWVRFHSLPGSKRYPENEDDYATVLSRHNRILGELTQSQRSVTLLTTCFSDSSKPMRSQPELVNLDPAARSWRTVPMHELEGGFGSPSYWHIYASSWQWTPGLFNPIVRLVADDVITNVMIVNPLCEWLLHPYDGGMDLVMESSEDRDRLKSTYLEWLSPRQDGL